MGDGVVSVKQKGKIGIGEDSKYLQLFNNL